MLSYRRGGHLGWSKAISLRLNFLLLVIPYVPSLHSHEYISSFVDIRYQIDKIPHEYGFCSVRNADDNLELTYLFFSQLVVP